MKGNILYRLIIFILLDLIQNGSGYRYIQRKSCRIKPRRIYTEAPYPPKPSGEWVSERCENRPGPEFLIRKYQFNDNQFVLRQYYYEDPGCTRHLYGVIAEGEFKILKRSWIVPGGSEVKYTTRNVTLIPYSQESINYFQKSSRNCPQLSAIIWKQFQKHKILNFPSLKHITHRKHIILDDFDCTRQFNLTFHEMQLMRLEVHRPRSFKSYSRFRTIKSKKSRVMRELYLGDIHTDATKRYSYRPISYQTPLKEAKVRKCRVCNQVANSNDFYPPTLRSRRLPRMVLTGDWISRRCEVRQYGQFLTRHLTFYSDYKSWQGHYDFFEDPLCTVASFSLFVKGSYADTGKSKVITGAKNYNFRITRLKVSLKSQMLVNNFNTYSYLGCGVPNSWKLNVEQDVTPSGGCILLGIKLPNVEFEIMKMDTIHRKLFLYIGERPTDGASLSSSALRPTSFQEPLVQCKHKQKSVKRLSNEIPTFQMLQQLPPSNVGSHVKTLIFLQLLLLLVFYLQN